MKKGIVYDKITLDDSVKIEDIIGPSGPLDRFYAEVAKAKKLAITEGIKANSIIINKNYVKIPELAVQNVGLLPPMICGLNMYFTVDDLPEGYSFAILEKPEPKKNTVEISVDDYNALKDILSRYEKEK